MLLYVGTTTLFHFFYSAWYTPWATWLVLKCYLMQCAFFLKCYLMQCATGSSIARLTRRCKRAEHCQRNRRRRDFIRSTSYNAQMQKMRRRSGHSVSLRFIAFLPFQDDENDDDLRTRKKGDIKRGRTKKERRRWTHAPQQLTKGYCPIGRRRQHEWLVDLWWNCTIV